MKYKKACEKCGHTSTAYTHNLNRPMVNAFVAMVDEYLSTKDLVNVYALSNLTYNQKCNFQKLRYFGLVDFIGSKGWYPTDFGLEFYYGNRRVKTPVATMANRVLAPDHPAWQTHAVTRRLVHISDYLEDFYKGRVEYQAEKSSQNTLF